MSDVINLRNTVMTENYDLNIWDREGYETEYEKEGWVINVYQYPAVGSPYGSGTMLEDRTITLTPT